MNAKRTLSVVLAALMLLGALASCASDSSETSETSAAETTSALVESGPHETDRSEIRDSLPDGLNFDGVTWRIYVSNSTGDKFITGFEELEGEIVNDAVMDRNLNVQERLNFVLETYTSNDTWQDNHTRVSALIMANDDTYDLFMGLQTSMPQLIPQKMFVNAYDLKYIDFDQPWWVNNYMDELALGKDYRYLMVSDFNTQALSYLRTNFFNKALYEDLYGDPNELYQQVLDGNWMLDDMQELVQGAYKDLDGNGMVDPTDQLGFFANQLFSTVDAFVYGSNVEFTTRDSEGFIELNIISDEAVLLAEQLQKFFYGAGVHTKSEGTEATAFKAGTVLFITGQMATTNNLRDMEQDFGFLPFPKTSEDQKEYKTLVHDTAQLSCVPVSSGNIDITGAILEAMSAESYRTVTPAYYESALKLKYARDDISSQMIDLMRNSMTTNFIFAYNFALNNLGQVYRTLLSTNSTDYVSKVTSILPAAEAMLAEQVKVFRGE